MRHYLLWPDKLADGWEKNGPNYNAYCGNATNAPKPYKPMQDADKNRRARRDVRGHAVGQVRERQLPALGA